MAITTVRLQNEIEDQLDTLAKKLKRSNSWVINEALSEYLSKQEREQERWKQTLAAMESVAQGKILDGNEVHNWLNSWGTQNELQVPETE
jgi:predicted transcriptional regulator